MRISNPDWKNWWYYHKWYVLSGAVLPQDTVNAIQETFCALAGDYNRDGEVMVQVNQYILNQETADVETAYSGYASEITLTADISELVRKNTAKIWQKCLLHFLRDAVTTKTHTKFLKITAPKYKLSKYQMHICIPI